jgi:thioredoxin reductase (NADPH)
MPIAPTGTVRKNRKSMNMSTATQFDIAVIGGGVAGLTAVQHALQGGCSVAHVMGTEPIGGLVCNVGELQGFPAAEQPISGIALAIGLSASNAELGATEMLADATALHRDGSRFRLETSEGEIGAGQVIAATGARLRMLDVPGAHELVGRGVSQCAWCDGALYKGKDVVVVGGGDAALEEALHLAQFAAKVTVVTRGDRFRARQAYVSQIAELETVDFRWTCDVVEVVGSDGVEAIRIVDKESGATGDLACSGVFVFVGLEPNSAVFAKHVELNSEGCIKTTEAMETATPGVFAIGAVRSGYRGRLVHAVGEAATAAMAAVSLSTRG